MVNKEMTKSTMSVNTALKTIRQYMGLYTDYRKPKAIEALNRLQDELKLAKKRYDELFRENKRLREILERNSIEMDV